MSTDHRDASEPDARGANPHPRGSAEWMFFERRKSWLERNDLRARLAAAEQELVALRTLGERVNAIRNSIVGFQRLNWSEHVYPLVAALDEAGLVGFPYPTARERVATLLEQVKRGEAAELALAAMTAERDAARAEVETLRAAVRKILDAPIGDEENTAMAEASDLLRALAAPSVPSNQADG